MKNNDGVSTRKSGLKWKREEGKLSVRTSINRTKNMKQKMMSGGNE